MAPMPIDPPDELEADQRAAVRALRTMMTDACRVQMLVHTRLGRREDPDAVGIISAGLVCAIGDLTAEYPALPELIARAIADDERARHTRHATALAVLRTGGDFAQAAESAGLSVDEVQQVWGDAAVQLVKPDETIPEKRRTA